MFSFGQNETTTPIPYGNAALACDSSGWWQFQLDYNIVLMNCVKYFKKVLQIFYLKLCPLILKKN